MPARKRSTRTEPTRYRAKGYGASRIVDPQAWGEYLAAKAAGNGGQIDPEAILAEISDPEHRFHSYIPEESWDDARAAHLHRLALVRNLIRSVEVEHGTEEIRKAFHGIRCETYVATGKIVATPTRLQSGIAQALSRLRGAHDSLTDLLASAKDAGTLDTKSISEALDWLAKAEGIVSRLRDPAA